MKSTGSKGVKKTIKVKFSSEIEEVPVTNAAKDEPEETKKPDVAPSEDIVEDVENNRKKNKKAESDSSSEESDTETSFAMQLAKAKSKLKRPSDSDSRPQTVNVAGAVAKKPSAFESAESYLKYFASKRVKSADSISFSALPELSDAHFFFWDSFESVSIVNVSYCQNISDLGLAQFVKGFPSLKELHVTGCRLVTEASIYLLFSKCQELKLFNADFTSVRYVPTGISTSSVSVVGCPLVLPLELTEDETKITSDVTKKLFTWTKVFVVKPSEMKTYFISPELLPPDEDAAKPALMEPFTWYKSGPYRVVECTEDSPLELVLTNNSLVIFPFFPGPFPPFSSVECRFNLVTALLTSFKSLCIPVVRKKVEDGTLGAEISEDSPLDNQVITNMTSSFTKKVSGMRMMPIGAGHLTVASCSAHLIPDILSSVAFITLWLKNNQQHAKLPNKIVNVLFEAFQKSKVHERGVFTVNELACTMATLVPIGCSWQSFAEILSETGNVWLEPSCSTDGPFHGPHHVIFTVDKFVKVLQEFATANDITPSEVDVFSIAESTPLCSTSRLKNALRGEPSSLLPENDCDRLLSTFELMGLGIFRRNYALCMSNLPAEPPLSLDAYVSKNPSIFLRYPVNCRPSSVIGRLISLLCMFMPPTLLWKDGAIFDELSVMTVLVQPIDHYREIAVVIFGMTSTELVRESCSLFHSLCVIALSKFSTDNLFALPSAPKDIRVISPTRVLHSIKEFGQNGFRPRTFSREFDPYVPRCEDCLIDVKLLSSLRSLLISYLAPISNHLVRLHHGQEHTYIIMPLLYAADSSGVTGYSGQPSTAVEIFGIRDLAEISVNVSENLLDPKNLLKISLDGDSITGFSSTANDSKGGAKISARLGLRVEVYRLSHGGVTVTVSVNGLAVWQETFQVATRHFSLMFQPRGGQEKKEQHTLIFVRTNGQVLPFRSSRNVTVGMLLEAVDPEKPDRVIAASIAEINEDNGKWLLSPIASKTNKFWCDPATSMVFPCGFIEFICNDQNRVVEFVKHWGNNSLISLGKGWQGPQALVPHGAGSSFRWLSFVHHDRHSIDGSIITKDPVPFHFFNQEKLQNFPPDFLSRYHLPVIAEANSLTKACIKRRLTAIENANLSFVDQRYKRSLLLVPLPPLTWLELCWPGFQTLVKPKALPHFLCGFPEMIHFVNESPADIKLPEFSIRVRSATTIAILVKMLEQPRFLPDDCSKLFPAIEDVCNYPRAKISKGLTSKAEIIEKHLRTSVFPLLLDHLILYELLRIEKGSDEAAIKEGDVNDLDVDGEEAAESSKRTFVYRSYRAAMTIYENFLRGIDSSHNQRPATVRPSKSLPVEKLSSWSRVLMPDPPCRLLLMSDAEKEFYHSSGDCPKLLCGQHAYHFITFAKATQPGFDDIDIDGSIDEVSLGRFHDALLTMYCARNRLEDFQKFALAHPYMGHLYLGKAGMNSVSGELSSLRHLCEISLVGNNLADLPAAFENLAPSLKFLDISLNNFSTLPQVVYKLTNLESLQANFMRVSTLDKLIDNLKKLRLLSLRHNCLKTIPSTLSQLTDLEVLDLSALPTYPNGNDSAYIEEVVSFFKEHHFGNEGLDLLTKWIQEFSKTMSTSSESRLDQKSITRLNDFMFDEIPRLGSNKFPLEIYAMTKLQELSLANQGFQTVPDGIEKLTKLRRLDLHGCLRLERISARISSVPLQALRLNDCPELKTPPPEIRKRGFAATIAFFRRLSAGSVKCQRTKLMFVGLGGAGKTSLVWSLMNKKPIATAAPNLSAMPVTDGIDIAEWKVDTKSNSSIDFRMWDFAGQVVYYNTHQFFLSSRAIYLILWNIRLGHEYAGLDFWLSSIACHAPNAPVLVVGTHVDKVSQERSFLPEINYRKRFNNIRGFHYVSSFSGQGVDLLHDDIVQLALAQKHMGEEIPSAWLTFEQKLTKVVHDAPDAETKSKTSVLPLSDVYHISDASGIYEEDEVVQALQFLSDIGSVQYFRTDFLADRVIVNPQWIVDVMACIVSIKDTPIKDGRLHHADIAKLWSNYSPDLHSWLIKLTEAFDLTFPLRDSQVSIVPCLLPENAPESIDWPALEDHADQRQMRLSFKFKYLPTGLFNRAQVRLQNFADVSTIWRKGSLLQKNAHLALITQPNSTTVHVKVQGPRPENLTFLVLEVFDSLLVDSFNGLQPELSFSCPECVHLRVNEPSMFERSRIRRATELHIPTMQCYHYFHQVPTQELRMLSPVQTNIDFDYQLARTLQELNGLAKSLQSDVIVVGCKSDLVPLEDKNLISAVNVGQDLETSSQGQLRVLAISDPSSVSFDQLSLHIRATQVLVCCISPNFMADERCLACLMCGHETLRKPILIVTVREVDVKTYPALAFIISDDIYVKAHSRAKYKPSDVYEAVQHRINAVKVANSNSTALGNQPPVFLSYCWKNSREAVENGTKSTAGAVGVTDPRQLKRYLAEQGVDCWIDIEQIGRGGLFEDLATGIRNAKVVVICVSDEYVESKNCLREFHFATAVCQLPVVLCAVGNGIAWKQSEVMLLSSDCVSVLNFQVNLSENFTQLADIVRPFTKPKVRKSAAAVNSSSSSNAKPSLSQIGRLKSMVEIQTASSSTRKDDEISSPESTTIAFKEIVELGQGRFLRQVAEYAQASGSRPYPRLVIIDLCPEQPALGELEPSSTLNDELALEGAINKLGWCLRFLCEHEAGWHPTSVTLALPEGVTPDELLQQTGPYLGRLFSLFRHGESLPNLVQPKNQSLSVLCQTILSNVEKSVRLEEAFDTEFSHLREMAMRLDTEQNAGGLARCQLTLGKELWLCAEHRNSALARTKSHSAPSKSQAANILPDQSIDASSSFISDAAFVRRWAKSSQTVADGKKYSSTESNESTSGSTLVESTIPVNISSKENPPKTLTSSRACLLQ